MKSGKLTCTKIDNRTRTFANNLLSILVCTPSKVSYDMCPQYANTSHELYTVLRWWIIQTPRSSYLPHFMLPEFSISKKCEFWRTDLRHLFDISNEMHKKDKKEDRRQSSISPQKCNNLLFSVCVTQGNDWKFNWWLFHQEIFDYK